jgi:hypothetical protein
VKPDDDEERRAKSAALRVLAFTFATISDNEALEHPSSEQKMRMVSLRIDHTIRLESDPFECWRKVQVTARTTGSHSLIDAAF